MFSKFFFFASIFLAEIAIISATGSNIVLGEASNTSLITCSKECNSCQLEDGKEVICDFSALKLFDVGSIAVLRGEFIKEKNMYAIRFFSKIKCVDINEPEQCSPLAPKEVEDASKIYYCSIPKKPCPTPSPAITEPVPTSSPPKMKDQYWMKYAKKKELSQSNRLEEKGEAPCDNLSILHRQTTLKICKAVVVQKYRVPLRFFRK